jgi:hypothetical protein
MLKMWSFSKMPYTEKQIRFFESHNIPYDKSAPIVKSKDALKTVEKDVKSDVSKAEKEILPKSKSKKKKGKVPKQLKRSRGHKCDLGKYCPLCIAQKAANRIDKII